MMVDTSDATASDEESQRSSRMIGPLTLWLGGASLLIYLGFKLYIARRRMYRLRQAVLPMPKYNAMAGHFPELQRYMKQVPADATINTTLAQMAPEFQDGMFYVDLWPISKPLLVVATPDGGQQLQQHTLDKPEELFDAFVRLTGGPNSFTMPAATWKTWRNIFNPGFNPGYFLGLAPAIAKEATTFCRLLENKAREGEIFRLEDVTLQLTTDTIVAVSLDLRLESQKIEHPLAKSLRTLIEWTPFGSELNPWNRYHPARRLVQWMQDRTIDRYIHQEIDRQYDELRHHQGYLKDGKASKSIISLVLQAYLKDRGDSAPLKLDTTFKHHATAQIRLFLIAGHDTTSSTLVYCYYLLSTHPEASCRLRDELDSVLGADTEVYDIINAQPHLLNQLPYMTAVIKETLRLFPPASAMRGGKPGVYMTDDAGRKFPTEDCNIWVIHLLLQRNPKYWPNPDAFLPERWLIEDPDDSLYPPKGGWRPFEFGARNYIGQTLALLELKIVLAMTVRRFAIQAAYDEWDAAQGKTNDGRIKSAFGTRAYQVEGGGGGAHASDGLPCRVRFRVSE